MPPTLPKLTLRATRRSLTCRLWCDDRLPAEVVEAIWRGEVERLLYSSAPLQVKDRCIAVRYEHSSGPLLIKMHLWGDAWRTFRAVGREASARRCARLGLELHRRGIPTPAPRVCVERRIGPWNTRSFLVTDYIEGDSLYRYIRFGTRSSDDLRRVARQVAVIWQTMVESGISHNDMKPENFIVDERSDVWLIDLEKARLNDDASRHSNRCIADVKNFLHIRGWHSRREAREIFFDEFLKTPYGSWLETVSIVDEPDPKLSVMVPVEDEPRVSSISRAIDSVRDIADEVLLVATSASGSIEAVDRIVLCGNEAGKPRTAMPASGLGTSDWMLALQQNEIVTPFLAKELQQHIAEAQAPDAIRIRIEPQLFGRTVLSPAGQDREPVRLFRPDRCTLSLVNGQPAVVADPLRTRKLTGAIQQCVCASVAEFVEQLNDATTQNASRRRQRGERPAFLRALMKAIGCWLRRSIARDGIRSGSAGLQRAFLQSAFVFIEEAKLRQLSGEFFTSAMNANARIASPQSDVQLVAPPEDAPILKRAA
jgi:(heptosyl)LPS beta-1,4-glucosyltransferase